MRREPQVSQEQFDELCKQVGELKEQLREQLKEQEGTNRCAAKGHALEFKSARSFIVGLCDHKDILDYAYLFRCMRCGIEVEYDWEELAENEKEAMELLGLAPDEMFR